MPHQTCVLRTLNLCDGTQLEDSDRVLKSCLCWLERRANEAGYTGVAMGARADRYERESITIVDDLEVTGD